HSDFTVDCVHEALGPDFPITSVPAPLWERAQKLPPSVKLPITLDIDGMVIDTREPRLSDFRWSLQKEIDADLPPLPDNAKPKKQQVTLDGVIYTAVMNPWDGRKNWPEMVTGFCQAFRYKRNATLFLKMTHYDPSELLPEMLDALNKMT